MHGDAAAHVDLPQQLFQLLLLLMMMMTMR